MYRLIVSLTAFILSNNDIGFHPGFCSAGGPIISKRGRELEIQNENNGPFKRGSLDLGKTQNILILSSF